MTSVPAGESVTYAEYLHLDELLAAQHRLSVPAHHDELLFIVQHQTSELWFKLMLHELRSARELLGADQLKPALKRLARSKEILRTLTEQWSVLATLTPTEFSEFRAFLGTSSGFQSYQYRAVEFVLGNKSRSRLSMFKDGSTERALLSELLNARGIYDEFLHFLARAGYAVPAEVLEHDVTEPRPFAPTLLPVLLEIYSDPAQHWVAYEACEELVDLEDNFQLWRFRHVRTVERIIGNKPGTGGSSGVEFLRCALDITFFPELFAVRTDIGA